MRVTQDGYTLERVDVHGHTSLPLGGSEGEGGGHEAATVVLVRGAECYVGQNDNPSFGACVRACVRSPSAYHSDDALLPHYSWVGVTRRAREYGLARRGPVRA